MRCPRCGAKTKKDDTTCSECSLKLPPRPTFIERLLFLPIPEILFSLAMIAGICLLVYRFATPTLNQEPILNYNSVIEIDSNIGVVFFRGAESEYVEEITSGIKKLDIEGDSNVTYKYNTDEDCYEQAIDALVNEKSCDNIIITSNIHYDIFNSIASKYSDTRFYVLWGTEQYTYTPPANVQICRVEISKAVYSIGVNSAHFLTSKIQGLDVTDPRYSETNHMVVYLYKTDTGKKYYDRFVTGVKKINPNLSIHDYRIENEAEYAQKLANSQDIYAVMLGDEMTEFTDALSDIKPDNIYLSGLTDDVKSYDKYLCAIRCDNSTYISYIFRSISANEEPGTIHNGNYEDKYCRIDYNKSIISTLK